jgi:hypothetical protein
VTAKPEKREIRERPPNSDDEFVDGLREKCARAMAAHLKQAVNVQRPINSLTLPEMMALAEACTAHWIVEVSARVAKEDLSPTERQFKNLLYG